MARKIQIFPLVLSVHRGYVMKNSFRDSRMKNLIIILFSLCIMALTASLTALDMTEVEEILLISAYEGDLKEVKDMISNGVLS